MKKMKLTAAMTILLCMLLSMLTYGMVNAANGPESAQKTTQGPAAAQSTQTTAVASSQTVTAGQKAATGPAMAAQQAQASQQAQETAQTQQQTQQASGGRTIDPSKPMIAITYDDGPQTEAGNRIIDTYLKYGQRCTFFVVGDRVASRASEVKRMAENGFEIGNHSYSHKYLNKCDAATIREEVRKCNEAVAAVTGTTPKIMRLPGGNKNDTVLANVNMPIILWNVDTRDWDHRNAQKSIDAVVGKVKDGDVVLMHELYSATADATETIVPALVQQGFQLVTVSELMQYKGITPENRIYYSF